MHKKQVSTLVGRIGNRALSGGTLITEGKKIGGIGFSGIFMQNQTPPLRPGSFIMNNDVTSGPGIHWVACVVVGKTIYVYDSFGRRSRTLLPIFSQLMKKNGYRIINTDLSDQDQFGTSVTCGHRCLSALKIFKTYGLKGFKLL